MGVVRRGSRYFIRVFSEATTFRNAEATGFLVANFIPDARVYVLSAFRDLPPEYFRFEEGMAPPRLRDACGWAFFRCHAGDVLGLEPVSATIAACLPPVFNRGFAAVLEAAIVGTRLHLYKGDEGLDKIREYEAVVRKCGSPADVEAMGMLKRILGIA